MSIAKTRSWLYWAAKMLGDVQALTNGKIAKRVARRIAGKYTNRGLGGLFR